LVVALPLGEHDEHGLICVRVEIVEDHRGAVPGPFFVLVAADSSSKYSTEYCLLGIAGRRVHCIQRFTPIAQS
jgi:hypothetical protein